MKNEIETDVCTNCTHMCVNTLDIALLMVHHKSAAQMTIKST